MLSGKRPSVFFSTAHRRDVRLQWKHPSKDQDEVIDMKFAKDNAAIEGFNRWTINGASYAMDQ